MKKYLPFAYCYILYASIIWVWLKVEFNCNKTTTFVIWLVIIPLIIAGIYYIIKRRKAMEDTFFDDIEGSTIEPEPAPQPIPTPPTDQSLFIQDWSLLDFALEFGPQMQVGQATNKNGETYHLCRFIKKDGSITRVYFFSQLGELTPAEITARKNELYVGLMSSGKYYLHDKNVKAWEIVELGI